MSVIVDASGRLVAVRPASRFELGLRVGTSLTRRSVTSRDWLVGGLML